LIAKPELFAAVLAAASVCAAAGTAFAASAKPDLTGAWWATSVADRLQPQGGGAIPFTAAGKAAYDKRQAEQKADPTVDRTVHLCLPQGVVRAWMSAYPFQVLQTTAPDQVTVMFEENRGLRPIRFRDKHFDPELWDPSYMGDSIARWDGDVLVVDTTNFNDDTTLDPTGLPHSDKLHVTERIRLLNGGRQLEVVATIEDPEIYSRPWSVRFTYDRRDDVQVKSDWVCGEQHRDVSSVRRASAGR